LANAPEEIDCTLTGYFAICCEHKILPEYLLPPFNIRIIVSCQSDQMVRDWANQLSSLLNENGIDTQFKDNGSNLEIDTRDKES